MEQDASSEASWQFGLGVGPNFTQADVVGDKLKSDIGASAWARRLKPDSRFFPQLTVDYFKFGSSTHMENYLLGLGYNVYDGQTFRHDALVGIGIGRAIKFPQATPDQTQPAVQLRYSLEYKWKPNLSLGVAFEFIAIDLDNKLAKDAQVGLPMVFLAWQPSSKESTNAKPNEVVVNQDLDSDGVPNKKDRCPNTPLGATVNKFGCVPKERIEMRIMVNFETDSDVIPTADYQELEDLARVLQENPKSTVTIEGHTDSTGRLEYNMKLSAQRAASVRRHLIEKHSVLATRIRSKGFGPTQPVADNETPEGRFQNRRVLAVFQDNESEK